MEIFNKRSAMFTYNQWNLHNSKVAKAVMRISSGKKINSAADDPAGLAVSERMRAQLTMLARQKENAADMIGAANTADAIMAGTQDILRRLTDLATQAASGTLSDDDRKILDAEYQELLKGLDYSATHGEFSETQMFVDIRDRVVNTVTLGAGGATAGDSSALVPVGGATDGTVAAPDTSDEPFELNNINLGDYLDALDDFLAKNSTLRPDEVRSAVLEFTKQYKQTATPSNPFAGPNAGGYTLIVENNNVTIRKESFDRGTLGLGGTSLATQKGAREAMDALKKAGETVSIQRAQYGALQNRLEHRINSLTAMEEGLEAAYSRITDADIAKEMMEYTRQSLLAQVSAIMMTHVKSDAQQVLELLR